MTDGYDVTGLGLGAGPLRVPGVGRDGENERALVLYCNRRPTDDEVRTVHDYLRARVYTPGRVDIVNVAGDRLASILVQPGQTATWVLPRTSAPGRAPGAALDHEAGARVDYVALALKLAQWLTPDSVGRSPNLQVVASLVVKDALAEIDRHRAAAPVADVAPMIEELTWLAGVERHLRPERAAFLDKAAAALTRLGAELAAQEAGWPAWLEDRRAMTARVERAEADAARLREALTKIAAPPGMVDVNSAVEMAQIARAALAAKGGETP